ncbi:MAG: HAMP domain-containing histidine kinase [Ruminococcus sp.]|jgi:signal transduction histidine kinase|nr:HAMP domain-containing histidine kinase [Ruminococcus sp.]
MLKKAFSDVFSAVAGVTTAVLLIASAVLCGTALMAFVEDQYGELYGETDAEFVYSDEGVLRSSKGVYAAPAYIEAKRLENAPTPAISTLYGSFSEPVFMNISHVSNGYIIRVNSPADFNAYLLRLILSAVIIDLIGIVVIFASAYFVTKRFISPIEDMTVKVAEFENGDFSTRVKVDSDSEIGFLADSLNRMASTIEQTEDNRKAFVANVSHELRTPMTSISGFVDGILDGTVAPEDVERYLILVSTETKRLSRLVTNMLSLSAFDAGKMSPRYSRFDLLPEFLTVLTHFRDTIVKKNITINTGDYTEFIITGDVDLINQVVFNLVENAVKFTEDDGEIDITLISTETESSIRIKNTGGGLRANEISKVFERFYKSDTSRSKDKYGAGLGLSIVSSIIKLHKGKLIVRSEPDKFTEFEVTLPKV